MHKHGFCLEVVCVPPFPTHGWSEDNAYSGNEYQCNVHPVNMHTLASRMQTLGHVQTPHHYAGILDALLGGLSDVGFSQSKGSTLSTHISQLRRSNTFAKFIAVRSLFATALVHRLNPRFLF